MHPQHLKVCDKLNGIHHLEGRNNSKYFWVLINAEYTVFEHNILNRSSQFLIFQAFNTDRYAEVGVALENNALMTKIHVYLKLSFNNKVLICSITV